MTALMIAALSFATAAEPVWSKVAPSDQLVLEMAQPRSGTVDFGIDLMSRGRLVDQVRCTYDERNREAKVVCDGEPLAVMAWSTDRTRVVSIDLSTMRAMTDDRTVDISAYASAVWYPPFWPFFDGGWVCETSRFDDADCRLRCSTSGGGNGPATASATPSPPNADASSPPSCVVTCLCANGDLKDLDRDPVDYEDIGGGYF